MEKQTITKNIGNKSLVKRNLYRIIWTQSYDRGLEHLLKMWLDIKKEVLQAELHIFYGWQLFDQFHKNDASAMAWKENILKMIGYDGIIDHGRLPQYELNKEYEKSGIWAYPTHFGEINCISAIKAQALGCEPVIVNYAALRETVQFGRIVEGDIYDEETQELFKIQLIQALKNPMGEDKRKEMMKWAIEKYSWDIISSQWDKEFKNGG